MSPFYASSKGFIGEVYCTDGGILTVKKLNIDYDTKQLKIVGEFSWEIKVKVETLAVNTIEETLTGHDIPVALVKSSLKDNIVTCYVVCIDLVNEKFIPLRRFGIDKKYVRAVSSANDAYDVMLLNGPTVVVCYKSEVLIYGLESVIYEQFVFDINCLKEDIEKCCIQSTVGLKYQGTLETRTTCDKYLLFLQIQVKFKCSEHGSVKHTILRVLQFSDKQFTVLNTSMTRHIIPEEYVECVSSLCVKKLSFLNPDTMSCDCEVYVGTSEGYVIHLKNGNLMHCIDLSEEYSITAMKILNSDTPEETGILAKTEEGVWTELTNELQVKIGYSDITNTFQGDFLKNGYLQLLLLKGGVAEGAPWVLTDLKSRCLTSDQDEQSTHKQVSKNSSTAVKALRARLQREQSLLHDEELQLRRREDFISDMFSKQVSIAAGTTWKPQFRQPTMVNLIMGESSDTQPPRSQSKTRVEPAVRVKGHWQRTYGDSWCVGIDLVCQCERLTKVWLDVIPDEFYSRSVAMKSSCVTLSGNQTTGNSRTNGTRKLGNQTTGSDGTSAGSSKNLVPRKRQKLSEKVRFEDYGKNLLENDKGKIEMTEGTSVCVLPLPVFGSSNSVTANLVLNWTRVEQAIEDASTLHTDSTDEAREKELGSKLFTHCCGKVHLKTTDVLEGKFELDFHVNRDDQDMEDFRDARNNWLAWRHIQTCHHLVVKGSPGILAKFESLLTHTCGFVHNIHYDCYVSMVKALSRVQIELDIQTSDEHRQLTVYTSKDKDLFLTIHHLYAHLPDQVVILPREKTSADMVQRCLPALQKEADFLSHGLRKLLNDHEAEQASADSDDGEEEDMRKVGEKFKRKREKILKTKSDVIKNERVKEFIKQYRRVQDLTDLAIITADKTN